MPPLSVGGASLLKPVSPAPANGLLKPPGGVEKDNAKVLKGVKTGPALRHNHENQPEIDEEMGGIGMGGPKGVVEGPGSPQRGLALSPKKAGKYVVVSKMIILAMVFTMSLSLVVMIFLHLPKVRSLHGDGEEVELLLKMPKNMEELRVVKHTLELYQEQYRVHVAVGIVVLYLFLQTFIIPGSIFLNMLAGSLYGFYKALALVTIAAGVGSACCYGLSYWTLKDLVHRYLPEKCDFLSREVQRHRENLFFYILFLRITPIFPNWFVNLAAPVVAVPFPEFFLGSLIGLMPGGLLTVKAGRMLSKISSVADLYDVQTVLSLLAVGVLALVPVYIKRRFERQGHGEGKVI